MLEISIVVAAVITISAMCSLFEAALYSVPIGHIESLAEKKKLSGLILRRLRKNVDTPIAAILSLNTIANTAGAAVAGAAVDQVFGSKWVGFFSAGLTFAILVFAEAIPKTAGVVYSRALAPFIAIPLQIMIWVAYPLVILCRLATYVVSRGRNRDESVSDHELIVMTKLGLKAGTIDKGEAEVIQNILELEKKKARDIMTPRSVMVALPGNITAEEARGHDKFYTHSRFPIYGENPDEIIGIAPRPKILRALAEDRKETRLDKIMRPVFFITDDTPVNHLLRLFLEKRQHLFVLIDDHGGTSGVVTLEDVIEEILGEEIIDESDKVVDLRELAQKRREELLGRSGDSPPKGQG